MQIFTNILLEVQRQCPWKDEGKESPLSGRFWSLDGHARALMMRGMLELARNIYFQLCFTGAAPIRSAKGMWLPPLKEIDLFSEAETGELFFSWVNEASLLFEVVLSRLFNGQTFGGGRRGEELELNSIEIRTALRGDLKQEVSEGIQKDCCSSNPELTRRMFLPR